MRSFNLWVTVIISVLCFSLLFTAPSSVVLAEEENVPNLDIILITDQSDSMWKANDRDQWRIQMVNLFISLLGVEKSGALHELGIVYFGTDASLIAPLTPISAFNQLTEIAQNPENNRPSGATEMPKAFDLAFQELKLHGRPEARKVIVFLTDGHCEIQANTLETANCSQTVRAVVNRNKGDQGNGTANQVVVYTIAFTDRAQTREGQSNIYKTLMEEIASMTGGRYFEPDNARDDLLHVYMQIIQDVLGLAPKNFSEKVIAPTSVEFNVAPNLYQVVFTSVKEDLGIGMRVSDPDGFVVDDKYPSESHRATAGKTEVVSIKNPTPGKWKIELEGKGAVTVLLVPFSHHNNRLNLIQPASAHPWGKPLEIIAEVVDENNKTAKAENLIGEVVYPDGTQKSVSFTSAAGSKYHAVLEDTSQVGGYTIKFSAAETSANLGVETEKTVSVVRAPWIKILDPKSGGLVPVNSDAKISVQLMWGTEPLKDPGNTGEYLVQANVRQADNLAQITSQDLTLQLDGIFDAPLQADREMDAQIAVVMNYTSPGGEPFIDVTETNFKFGQPLPATKEPAVTAVSTSTATPIPSPTPKPTIAAIPPSPPSTGTVVGGIIGLLLIVVASFAGAWWYNQPSLTGMMDFDGVVTPLSGKGAMHMGSDPKSQFHIVSDENILPRHALIRPVGSRKHPQVELYSLDPGNPVSVNGFPASMSILKDGDKIRIGDQEMVFTGPPEFDFSDVTTNLDDYSSNL